MYSISTKTAHPTAIFAAEELKKYLRMMMPRVGNIPIYPATDLPESFCLGLMQDFGLDISDAEDPALDDIVYIDTTERSGIIAGSNYGALLIAVYRYLRECGCRWLFPGIDGEWIPNRTSLESVKYRKLADHRYRGQCNEGAEYQTNMLETIDFTPKIGMNTYMIEFDIPYLYYYGYYSHYGSSVREPEPITNETVLQWKRQCEVEIQKRGLHFHDMGHGWTCEPFGIDSKLAIVPDTLPDEVRENLAMVNGKRGFAGRVIDTQVCMSNPKVRAKMANYIADYAETQDNVDFLHIWLGDGTRQHCECEACRKKIVTDWYVILLNEIDAELTRRNLDTHLVFLAYHELFWPPIEAKLNNEKRFTMLYAPITRLYTETYGKVPDESAVEPFVLNKTKDPRGMSECLGYLSAWKKIWTGDCFCYEYHFWKHQYFDQSGMYLAKLIYDDISALRSRGLSGMVEDGSQRSYFPTGFPYYVYGETLFDASRSFEELTEDYFSHAFGEHWQEVVEYLNKVRDILDFKYFSGMMSTNPAKGAYYNPEVAKLVEQIPILTASMTSLIATEKNQPMRASSVSWRMLDCHRAWIEGLSTAVQYLAAGDKNMALCAIKRLFHEFSEREIYIERYFDLELAYIHLSSGRVEK